MAKKVVMAAYERGQRDAAGGKAISDCPYDEYEKPDDRSEWFNGFRSAATAASAYHKSHVCRNCKWWLPSGTAKALGECHGGPPSVVLVQGAKGGGEMRRASAWPITLPSESCRAFGRKPGDKPEPKRKF